MIRKICIFLGLVLLLNSVTGVSAAEDNRGLAHIQKLVELHRFGGSGTEASIRQELELLAAENPVQGEIWSRILEKWEWVDNMEIPGSVLPDGLPEDDSLCIVVMGFRLEDDGRMKPELHQRLQAALDSARKYPNALVICTGGATAKYAQITEAEAMKNWLVEQGLEESRVVAETRANSSLENARYTYRLLQEAYPMVDTIALVTSEYHIPRCTMIFYGVGLYETPLDAYSLQGSAVCITGRAGNNERKQTADNLLQIAWESRIPVWEPAQPETEAAQPETEPETVPPETKTQPEEAVVPTTTESVSMQEAAPEQAQADAAVSAPGWVSGAIGGLLLTAFGLLLLLLRIVRKRK